MLPGVCVTPSAFGDMGSTEHFSEYVLSNWPWQVGRWTRTMTKCRRNMPASHFGLCLVDRGQRPHFLCSKWTCQRGAMYLSLYRANRPHSRHEPEKQCSPAVSDISWLGTEIQPCRQKHFNLYPHGQIRPRSQVRVRPVSDAHSPSQNSFTLLCFWEVGESGAY